MPTDEKGKNKFQKEPRAKAFMERHGGELFQVELDGLPLIAPEEIKEMVLGSVDNYFDEKIRNKVLSYYLHSKIKREIKRLVVKKAKELLHEN